MNVPTLIISLALAGLIGLIIALQIRGRKKGGCCGCSSCALKGQCHKQ